MSRRWWCWITVFLLTGPALGCKGKTARNKLSSMKPREACEALLKRTLKCHKAINASRVKQLGLTGEARVQRLRALEREFNAIAGMSGEACRKATADLLRLQPKVERCWAKAGCDAFGRCMAEVMEAELNRARGDARRRLREVREQTEADHRSAASRQLEKQKALEAAQAAALRKKQALLKESEKVRKQALEKQKELERLKEQLKEQLQRAGMGR